MGGERDGRSRVWSEHFARLRSLYRRDVVSAGPLEADCAAPGRSVRFVVPHQSASADSFGSEHPVTGRNPPLNIAGMTLIVMDASGRLPSSSRSRARPVCRGTAPPPHRSTGRSFSTPPRWTCPDSPGGPTLGARHVRRSADGVGRRTAGASRPEVRVEAATFGGKPVSFVLGGPWSQSARTPAPPAAPTLWNQLVIGMQSLVIPGLDPGRRGSRPPQRQARTRRPQGAFRAAAVLFWLRVVAWLVGVRSVGVVAQDISGSSPRSARRSSTPHCSGSRTWPLNPTSASCRRTVSSDGRG